MADEIEIPVTQPVLLLVLSPVHGLLRRCMQGAENRTLEPVTSIRLKIEESWYASMDCKVQKSGPWVCFYGGHSTGYKLGHHPKNIEPCAHRARTVRAPCAHRATTPPNTVELARRKPRSHHLGLCLKRRGANGAVPERLPRDATAVGGGGGGRLLVVGNAVGAGVGVWECVWGRVKAGVLGGEGVPPPPLKRFPATTPLPGWSWSSEPDSGLKCISHWSRGNIGTHPWPPHRAGWICCETPHERTPLVH